MGQQQECVTVTNDWGGGPLSGDLQQGRPQVLISGHLRGECPASGKSPSGS